MNDNTSPNATEDMLADLFGRRHLPLAGDSGADADRMRALLSAVAGLAHEVPEPSDDVRALLGGATPLRPRRRVLVITAAAAGALALGGVSAAAAANRLPSSIQEVVADATGGVVPHPVKPTNPPYDAPGHVGNKPKATKTPKPGQIQKSTKPNPNAPGPARPSDPGSHGRAHSQTNVNSVDKLKTEPHRDKSD